MTDHTFCRLLLKVTRSELTAEQRRCLVGAWSYMYRRSGVAESGEFHVRDGFYWHGSACCSFYARQQGILAWLEHNQQEKTMKSYKGRPESEDWNQVGDVVVMAGGALDSEQCKLDPRFDLVNHSPTGFAWGYLGSGPAQLALAILADVTNTRQAMRHYQAFKFEKIATLPRGAWTIEEEDVLAWLAAREGSADD